MRRILTSFLLLLFLVKGSAQMPGAGFFMSLMGKDSATINDSLCAHGFHQSGKIIREKVCCGDMTARKPGDHFGMKYQCDSVSISLCISNSNSLEVISISIRKKAKSRNYISVFESYLNKNGFEAQQGTNWVSNGTYNCSTSCSPKSGAGIMIWNKKLFD